MANPLRSQVRPRHRNRGEERYCPHLLSRDGTGSNSRRSDHVLAVVGCHRCVDPLVLVSYSSTPGIFLGFCANVIFKDVGKNAWRLQLGSAFLPAFILLLGIWFCPESPRWLAKHGHYAKAFRSTLRLRSHPIIAARDFYYQCVIYDEELRGANGKGYFGRMRDCFTIPRIRRANYGASTVMIAQQMCGINSESCLTVSMGSNAWSSHLLLQFHDLRQCRLQCYSSPVCVIGIWCGSSCFHHSDPLLDRHEGSPIPDLACKQPKICLLGALTSPKTFPLMCIFLLAAGLSLLETTGSKGSRIGPVVLWVLHLA